MTPLKLKALVIQLVLVALFFATWEVVTGSGLVDRHVLPRFSASVAALWQILRDGSFLSQAGATAARILIAFAIAAPTGILVGLLIAEKLRFGRILSPIMHFVLAVPQAIFLPLFILAFGVGDLQKIVFGVTHAFFIIAVNTVAAVESVPRSYVVAARSFGAAPAQILTRIYLPAMLPVLLTGLRIGMILNIVSILFAEMYASRGGVGTLIMQWSDTLNTEKAMGAILLVTIFTIGLNQLGRRFEVKFGRWQIAAATR